MSRRFMILTGVFALAVTGCGGGEPSPNDPPPDIYGTWTLTRIRGGVGGIDVAPGYRETVLFRTNSTATIQVNDGSPVTGPFQAKRQQTDLQQQPLVVLTLPNGTQRALLNKTRTVMMLAEFNISDPQLFEYTRQAD